MKVESMKISAMEHTTYHVCSHFNESLGNGLFNLASELRLILWLRIWQCHFHTLRKWWFYTCWLSPYIKWMFHHCQQQMLRPSPCWIFKKEFCYNPLMWQEKKSFTGVHYFVKNINPATMQVVINEILNHSQQQGSSWYIAKIGVTGTP